ncbi:MAG: hypothetical protein R2733_11585 [Acidimicrobiales bacterium]
MTSSDPCEVVMLCFSSAKGGAGCSVTAAAVALLLSEHEPVLLVDLAGDMGEVLGSSGGAPREHALDQWGRSVDPAPDALRSFETRVTEQLTVLGSGSGPADLPHERLGLLATLLRSDHRRVVVDVGHHQRLLPIVEQATRSVLVTRQCYVALSKARHRPAPDDVVVIAEPHRALTTADVESVLGAPVVATIPYEPQIFRAVDAGLLVRRMPGTLRRLAVF